MNDYKKYIENIRKELKGYIVKNHIKSLVMGISGGADSALVALLARPVCDELDIPLIGTSITIETNKSSEIIRANSVGLMTCTKFKEVDLTELFYETTFHMGIVDHSALNKEEKIRRGNIKARLRMIYLYNLASVHGGMVLSTDNYTEYLLGFWTLHGDVGDYGMIQELWKTEVYEMLEYLRDETTHIGYKATITYVIDADATDGLGVSNTDLDQILPGWEGSSKDGYAEVDILLKSAYHDVYASHPVLDRMLATKFKRENPVNIPRETIVR